MQARIYAHAHSYTMPLPSLGPSLFPAYVILPPPKSSLDKRLPFSCVTVWNAELLINSVLSKHAVQLAYARGTNGYTATPLSDLDSAASKLGISSLKDRQREAITSFVDGHDVFVSFRFLPSMESLSVTLCFLW